MGKGEIQFPGADFSADLAEQFQLFLETAAQPQRIQQQTQNPENSKNRPPQVFKGRQ